MNTQGRTQGRTPTARLAQPRDLEALVRLSQKAAPRVYTLPRSREELQRAIERSIDAASRAVEVPADEHYLMVLEAADGELIGVAAIRASAGSQGTFFAFRNDVIHHASREVKISNSVHVLTLSSDLTGHSQLSSFFVDAERAGAADAALLSRARLALVACDRPRFAPDFFVSFAGWCDEHMASPFWDAIGRKFFGMDFIDAERAVSGVRNRSLIIELMPRYPVYVPLLQPAARAAIGQLHDQVSMAYDILSAEGFEGETYVDIFDGGPILLAQAADVRTLKTACHRTAQAMDGDGAGDGDGTSAGSAERLVCTAGALADFRCTRSAAVLDAQTVQLPPAAFEALGIAHGDRVLVADGAL